MVPSAFVSCSMNLDANCGPLSLRIFLDTLCNFQILSLYTFAMPSAEMFIIIAFSQIIFVNQSMITTITSILLDLGKSPMISMLISYHGPCGISSECNSLIFLWC